MQDNALYLYQCERLLFLPRRHSTFFSSQRIQIVVSLARYRQACFRNGTKDGDANPFCCWKNRFCWSSLSWSSKISSHMKVESSFILDNTIFTETKSFIDFHSKTSWVLISNAFRNFCRRQIFHPFQCYTANF